ncbi:MAG: hypothetical protein PHD60_08555 [Clostridia bacterium]|nr:hypothetical protein [Clostridia bacterium]
MLRLLNIKLRLNEVVTSQKEINSLRRAIINRLKINDEELIDYTIFKKSIDARKKDNIQCVYTIDVKIENEEIPAKKFGINEDVENNNGNNAKNKKCSNKGISKTPEVANKMLQCETEKQCATKKLSSRPVIVGTGPAGLFAGIILSRHGYEPILLERGEDVDARTARVSDFWGKGEFNGESNVQFGEGGAGTFSDGKLTTLIGDVRCRFVLEEFVKAGAPQEIMYLNKPHIGTDLLKVVVKKMREEIIKNGGEVRFQSKVTDIEIEDNKIKGLIINDSEKIKCQVVLLGIGHSARDTFNVLYQRGIKLTQKPFSIGVRIEHPQEMIDKAQYGNSVGHLGLGAADYKLVYHSKSGRSAYTFCVCPGGYVVAAASEENRIVTNGMSEYARDGKNANSALLVGVTPSDFTSEHPLAGVEFQRKWEGLAYQIAGGNYNAPVQLVGDFLTDKHSTSFGAVEPSYKPGINFAELKNCLPEYVIATLKEALPYFNTKIKGFSMSDAIMTGVETRSSSPIRINRDENYLSNIEGFYPMGEGAGYAGGIVSSAVDGIKVTEKIAEKFDPNR